jgi:hypothetical protein
MAYDSYAVHTIVMQDAKGERTSIPIYMRYDSGVATLSSIAAFLSGNITTLDAITDGQIVASSLSLQYALPGGIKSAPVADCDVEETGLITYVTNSPTKRAFAEDIGAFAQDKFVGGKIDLAQTDVAAWVTRATGSGGTFEFTNQDFLALLATARSGVKTFRKHRRAAKRT